jgi:hypothetical protein
LPPIGVTGVPVVGVVGAVAAENSAFISRLRSQHANPTDDEAAACDTPLPPGGSTPAASAIMGDYALLQRHMLEILPVVYDPVVGSRTSEPRRTTSIYWWPATRRKSLALATPFYMHVGGHGDPIKLATALRAALAESKTPLEASAAAAAPAVELDSGQLDQIVGVKGKENGGVYQFAVPRRQPIQEKEMALAPADPMGVATSINFQPTGGGKAAVTGDFVLTADEVNPVVKTLRESGIEVTAIHSHMLTEQPRLFFMHFWANDDASKLAHGLRAALDKTASAKD